MSENTLMRTSPPSRTSRRTGFTRTLAAGSAVAVLGLALLDSPAQAAVPRIGLGQAADYSVAGGQAVANTGPSTLDAGLALSPGTGLTGFPPGLVAGAIHVADAVAAQVQADLVLAYDEAAGRASDAVVAGDLVGRTLTAGTYTSADSLDVTGTLTLDAEGDPDAVFVFQVGSALTTGSASRVSLVDGAQACNVFWQVGSSATIGTASEFVGTVMALTSITVTTGSTVDGRMLARNGQVSLDTTTFVDSGCTPPDDGGGVVTTTAQTDVTPTGTDSSEAITTSESTATTNGGSTATVPPGTDALSTPTDATGTPPTTTAEGTTPVTTATPTPGMPTTTAPVTPLPPSGNASPPLAYTAAGPATGPALIVGLVSVVLGGLAVWAARRRSI